MRAAKAGQPNPDQKTTIPIKIGILGIVYSPTKKGHSKQGHAYFIDVVPTGLPTNVDGDISDAFEALVAASPPYTTRQKSR